MKFELYRILTLRGWRWRWRLRAANHEIIASGEDYHDRRDAAHAIDLVRAAAELHKRVDELQDWIRESPTAVGRDAGPRSVPRLALLDTRGRVVAEVQGTCRLDVSSYRHLVDHVVVEEVERD